jgi:hypothetical protein
MTPKSKSSKNRRPVCSAVFEAKPACELGFARADHDRSARVDPADVKIDRVPRGPATKNLEHPGTNQSLGETANEAVLDVTQTARQMSHDPQKVH